MITFNVENINCMNERLKLFTDYLAMCGADDDALFDSRLVCCELITNVLRHCGTSACFCGVAEEGRIIITVSAETPTGTIRIPSLPDVLAESGRGLYIVNAVADGNVTVAGGKVTVKLVLKKK